VANIIGTPAGETLIGTSDPDTIDGQGGDDTLLGLAGDDVLIGGSGDDIYHIENAGDVVMEAPGDVRDRVAAYVSYALGAGAEIEIVETITLSDTTPINLTGNEFGQLMIGNAGINTLIGNGGDDVLKGLGGNDTLIGGAGHDMLYGGLGNDTYFIDAQDQVIELAGEGNDRVATAVSYQLADGAEIETLEALLQTSTDAIDLTGNGYAQRLVGNAGNNRLDGGNGNDRLEGGDGNDILIGGAGVDQMYGGMGNDTYYVDNVADQVVEPNTHTPDLGGIDRVATSVSITVSNVEILEAVNLMDTTPINLTAHGNNETIIGNMGDNVINGGSVGRDVFIGLGGADTFRFDSLPPRGFGQFGRITDFTPGLDKIAIGQFGFGTNIPKGTLSPEVFANDAPTDPGDRVIYNTQTGELFWDNDGSGSGAGVLFARLDGIPTVTASDFIVI
jgi:Ca2+-binding RTX toxin-like protein